MALDPQTAPSLTKFELLAFDVFGTLIDENTGVHNQFQPLLSRLPPNHHARQSASQDPSFIEQQIDPITRHLAATSPSTPFTQNLATAYTQLASEWGATISPGEAEAFGRSMGSWPPFPDTVAAMQALSKHYKLVALSNTTNAVSKDLSAGPLKGVPWDAFYTGEDIGAFKPAKKNFEYLFDHVEAEFGVRKDRVLMVAQGELSDHGPAKELGFSSAWISRQRPEGERGSKGLSEGAVGKVSFQWRWKSLGAMAVDVEAAFEEGGAK